MALIFPWGFGSTIFDEKVSDIVVKVVAKVFAKLREKVCAKVYAKVCAKIGLSSQIRS